MTAAGSVRAALVAIVVGSTCVAPSAQTYRARTTSVPVYATVTKAGGALVPYLTVEDFEVLDNGKPQAIDVFSSDVQPLSVVVMLDTSASMTAVLDDVKAAAEQFVIRLFPEDRARLCVFND